MDNSRPTQANTAIWRRRSCTKCTEVFSTYETTSLDYLIVEKRSGKRTKYLRHKLFASIYDAIISGKRKDHGDGAVLANTIVEQIENSIIIEKLRVVTTGKLIELALVELEKKDNGACYRYAAFSSYRGERFGIYQDL